LGLSVAPLHLLRRLEAVHRHRVITTGVGIAGPCRRAPIEAHPGGGAQLVVLRERQGICRSLELESGDEESLEEDKEKDDER